MAIEYIVIVILAIVVIGLVLLLMKTPKTTDEAGLKMLQQHLLELQKTVDSKISESNKMLNDNLKNSQESFQKNFAVTSKISENATKEIKDLATKLTKLEETNKQIIGISDQLEGLENILKNPKQRGVLGEYFLESLLKNVFQPNQYEMQYKFKDGEIVDAIIRIKDKIIPIDSKFSLENYNRLVVEKDKEKREKLEKEFKADLKKRIDETSKYIRPNEDTMEFAFMFIPSEGVYYDLLIQKVGTSKVNASDLIEYAFKDKHVVIVSPTSFFAYLQTVLQGMKALQIEEAAKDIQKHVGQLYKHLNAYEEIFQKLGNSLGTTVNHYNNAYKEFNKIDKDVVKITAGEAGGDLEVLQLDKPNIE